MTDGATRSALALVQAGLLALALAAMVVSVVQADFTLPKVSGLTNSSRTVWERAQDATNSDAVALTTLLTALAVAGAKRAVLSEGLKPTVVARARRIQQAAALPVFASLLWMNPFARWAGPISGDVGFLPPLGQPYFPLLIGAGAAWTIAGWAVFGASRKEAGDRAAGTRASRLWAALAPVPLAAALLLEIGRASGPWWQFIDRGWLLFTALVWIALLVLIFLERQQGDLAPRLQRGFWGSAILSGGIALLALGLVAAWAFETRAAGRLCTGNTRAVGSWQVSLREIMPVAGKDYTGLQARLTLLARNGEAVQARPELRDYFASHHAPLAGAETLMRRGGELLVLADGDRDSPGCARVSLVWRPLARWQLYGAWIAALGALLMAAAALRSAWWRADAWRRIGDRRSDRRADVP